MYIDAYAYKKCCRLKKTIWMHIAFALFNSGYSLFFAVELTLWGWGVSRLLVALIILAIGISVRWVCERRDRLLFFINQKKEIINCESLKNVDTSPSAPSTSSVEELIKLINLAGGQLRRVRQQMRSKRAKMILQSEGLLLKCLKILTDSSDLFAIKLNQVSHDKETKDLLGFLGAKVVSADHFESPFRMRNSVRTFENDTSEQFILHYDSYLQNNANEHLSHGDATRCIYAEDPLDLWQLFEPHVLQASADANKAENFEKNENDENGKTKNKKKEYSNFSLRRFVSKPPVPFVASSKWFKKLSFEWNINMIELEHHCSGNVLLSVGYDLLVGKIMKFNHRDVLTLRRFLYCVESLYQPNTYHNQLHAAQVAHCSLTLARMILNIDTVNSQDMGVFVIACLCHDIGHKGRNNAFYNNRQDCLVCFFL